jgi:hypothetical protein
MTAPTPPPTPRASEITQPEASAAIASAASVAGSAIPTTLVSKANAKDRLDFLWRIHAYTNDYIRFADTKAGFAAGTVLAVVGALVASHPFDSLSQSPLLQLHYRVWFSALALAVLVLSFICALLAIRPRLKSTAPRGFIFWESVMGHGSDMTYADECKKLSADEMELNVTRHIYALAAICKRKYFWTNLSILTGSVGGLLAGAVILTIRIFQRQSP